jgi:YebC/PmpR family DNA-binding regulatory protein
MAGHSKWANIQHRKKRQDNKRGKIFTKIIREITVATRMGGSDISSNPRLRLATDKALAANMPKDTIARAIKRGSGELDGVQYEQACYEGYGPCNVAFMVEALTDNRNRTVAEVRHAFSKHNGELKTSGSVAFLFQKKGKIFYPAKSDEEKILEIASEYGAEDILSEKNGDICVITSEDNFLKVKEALRKHQLQETESHLQMETATSVDLNENDSQKIINLIDALEDLDDTQEVWCNANFTIK